MAVYIDVIVDISVNSLDRIFQYRVPGELLDAVTVGCQVNVPFGSGNRRRQAYAKITTYMAGRAAEVLVFNSVTSGAANDIENATKIARAMVTMYGMSDKFGMMCLATVQNQYLEGGAGLICGENTASQIDDEVLSIINSSYAEAMKLLDENREILDSISDYLYQKETITGKEFMKMFRDMKGLPDPDEEKDGEESKEHENAQNDAQKDTTSAADPLLRNATDQPADTNESSEYTAPDDNTLNN